MEPIPTFFQPFSKVDCPVGNFGLLSNINDSMQNLFFLFFCPQHFKYKIMVFDENCIYPYYS